MWHAALANMWGCDIALLSLPVLRTNQQEILKLKVAGKLHDYMYISIHVSFTTSRHRILRGGTIY